MNDHVNWGEFFSMLAAVVISGGVCGCVLIGLAALAVRVV